MIDVLKRIDDLRMKRNWSIYKLAYESEITQSTLANMFTRKSLPSLSTLSQICNAFGITMSEFFDETEKEDDYELILLSEFKKLGDKNKKIAIDILNVLRENETKKSEN